MYMGTMEREPRIQQQPLIITNQFNLPDMVALVFFSLYSSLPLQLSRSNHSNN